MPYGFNEDRSKYEIQGGGGGLSPMFVHMAGTSIEDSHLDKTAREIYDHALHGGLVIWLGDSDPDQLEPSDMTNFILAVFTGMIYESDGVDGHYMLVFGYDTNTLIANTLDDYPRVAIM